MVDLTKVTSRDVEKSEYISTPLDMTPYRHCEKATTNFDILTLRLIKLDMTVTKKSPSG